MLTLELLGDFITEKLCHAVDASATDFEVSDSDILDNTLNLICSLKTTAQKPTFNFGLIQKARTRKG